MWNIQAVNALLFLRKMGNTTIIPKGLKLNPRFC